MDMLFFLIFWLWHYIDSGSFLWFNKRDFFKMCLLQVQHEQLSFTYTGAHTAGSQHIKALGIVDDWYPDLML